MKTGSYSLSNLKFVMNLTFFVGILMQGCSSVDKPDILFLPTSYKLITDELTPEERSKAGKIGVSSLSSTYSIKFEGVGTDGKLSGTGKGALKGGLLGLAAGAEMPLIAIITAPLGVTIGSIHGAATTESKKQVETQLRSAWQTARKNNLPEYLIDQIFLLQNERFNPPSTARRAMNIQTNHLSAEEIPKFDSRLEIAIVEIRTASIHGAFGARSRKVVDVNIAVEIRIVHCGDEVLLSEGRYFSCSSIFLDRTFKEWTHRNAKLLREEIGQGLKCIAKEIYRDYLQPGSSTTNRNFTSVILHQLNLPYLERNGLANISSPFQKLDKNEESGNQHVRRRTLERCARNQRLESRIRATRG